MHSKEHRSAKVFDFLLESLLLYPRGFQAKRNCQEFSLHLQKELYLLAEFLDIFEKICYTNYKRL